jgi:hypothetical protein
MSETKWLDWHPKPGDKIPAGTRCRHKSETSWRGVGGALTVSGCFINEFDYQIPAQKENEAMRYWHPRIEPMAKGWTLADVPDVVSCDVKTNDSRFYTAWVNHGTVYHMDEGGNENAMRYKPAECRVIRVIDPIPPGAMTLDKVPEGVRCVFESLGDLCVGFRRGSTTHGCNAGPMSAHKPGDCDVLHILDPPPEVAVTLENLPVGRVIEWIGQKFFRDGCEVPHCRFTKWSETGGLLFNCTGPTDSTWKVTDYLMELKEVV